jgi:hypothetical protein
MSFLDGNSDVLDRPVTKMYARGLSTRDLEDAFRDAIGEMLISKSAVSEITDQRHLRPQIGVGLLRHHHDPLWRGSA